MAMRRPWRKLAFVAIAVIAVAALGAIVMALWNTLMPGLFGLRALSFWQALGLLLLSRVLFGRFGRPGGPWGMRRHMMERWAQMTPQERERLRARWRSGGCGFREEGADTPDSAPTL